MGGQGVALVPGVAAFMIVVGLLAAAGPARRGLRVEPTEAGWRLYRGAQRMLALEDQLVADVAASGEGDLAGDLVLGASTGPAAVVVPVVLGEFQRLNSDVRVFLTVSDTHSVVERVAAFASNRSSPTRSSSSARPDIASPIGR